MKNRLCREFPDVLSFHLMALSLALEGKVGCGNYRYGFKNQSQAYPKSLVKTFSLVATVSQSFMRKEAVHISQTRNAQAIFVYS